MMKRSDSGAGVSRRAFLTAGAGFGLFNVVPASVLGAAAPSNQVTMALIGAGSMGMGNMRAFLGMPDVRVLAVCDVNREKRARGKAEVSRKSGCPVANPLIHASNAADGSVCAAVWTSAANRLSDGKITELSSCDPLSRPK